MIKDDILENDENDLEHDVIENSTRHQPPMVDVLSIDNELSTPKYRFKKNEHYLCYHGLLLYEAKCIDQRMKDNYRPEYKLHYCGWSTNWDEWVDEQRLVKIDDDGRKRQQQLLAQHGKGRARLQNKRTVAVYPNGKRTISRSISSTQTHNNIDSSPSSMSPTRITATTNDERTPSLSSRTGGGDDYYQSDTGSSEVTSKTSDIGVESINELEQPPTKKFKRTKKIKNDKKSDIDTSSLKSMSNGIHNHLNDISGEQQQSFRYGTSLSCDLSLEKNKSPSSTTSSSRYERGQSLATVNNRTNNNQFSKQLKLSSNELANQLVRRYYDYNIDWIKFPIELVEILVNDRDHITEQNHLVIIPPRKDYLNIKQIFEDYLQLQINECTLAQVVQIKHFITSIKEMFNIALSKSLLYRFERLQLKEILETHLSPIQLCDIYSSFHLLRFFWRIKDYLRLMMPKSGVGGDDDEYSILLGRIQHFIYYMEKNREKLFDYNEYDISTSEYLRSFLTYFD
ncbi:unnamed protein product [Didymodactylos carnosus]|uniref:MRG domain-containing protein n=1 Tax=Didymodactylos carnosus TaxID=1234261 RepID=A0A8S2EGE3_9BILA|nr:unnamed protein product [Didymodactylos carnosus]CAF3969193.1 unnamed protein product [Didymodactylos carnosus]